MPVIGGVNFGNLTDYLFVFTNGSVDANWQGATKGYVGDVAVDGNQASERTSGTVPYAGTIYTNAPALAAWQSIVDQNAGQAFAATGEPSRISGLETDLATAFSEINALTATSGYEGVSATSLNGLNTQNGINETFVINVTSGLAVSSQIQITGDPGDVFILRWDTSPGTPGYQGQVKFQSGGAIVPLGGLTPANFINVAGDINASGGGTTPLPPYPQGPRFDNGTGALIDGGSDFSGGGFFTGYWLTTGDPATGETAPLSNGIFVGGWYTSTTKFSMTSGTSGVYVAPNPDTLQAAIALTKYVSVDGGITWQDANTPPGPDLSAPTAPEYRYMVTNLGEVTLTDITLVDSVLGSIGLPTTTLSPGSSMEAYATGSFAPGDQCNTATATGSYSTGTVSATDAACYHGISTGCTVVGYQEVCVDADVSITATAAPGEPVTTCVTTPAVLPLGTLTCTPTSVPCGFTVQATLCVEVPLSFGATAATVEVRQSCAAPSPAGCLG